MFFYYKNSWMFSFAGAEQRITVDYLYRLPVTAESEITVILTNEKKMQIFDLLNKKELFVSSQKNAALTLADHEFSAILKKINKEWRLILLSGSGTLNNQQMIKHDYFLKKGDELSFGIHTLKIFPDEIHTTSGTIIDTELCEIYHSRYSLYKDYPDFHRSPRIIYREPEEAVTVNPPAEIQKEPREQLLKILLPPLTMLIVTGATALFRSNGLFIAVSAVTTLMTVGFSLQNYFKNKREFKIMMKERETYYTDYLIDKSVELYQLQRKQRQGQYYHYPNTAELLAVVSTYSARIFEKTTGHFDFLHYRLGLGQVKNTAAVSYTAVQREGGTDELEKQSERLYSRYLELEGMPIIANLLKAPVGYIGQRNLVLEQLHLMIIQLSVFHSYHDLQFILIFPEKEMAQWDWLRWLPHTRLQDMNLRGFVYNQRSRDQILSSLNRILCEREKALEGIGNSPDRASFFPHYVVVVTDEKLILDHSIMEFLYSNPLKLSCSLIFVKNVLSSLSDNIQTIIDIRDSTTGVLLLEEGQLKERPFCPDHFPKEFDKEEIPRLLAPLNHLQSVKSTIPETVTFFEMYGIERIEQIELLVRWTNHAPHKTLSVPIGVRGKNDLLLLNLHEKAHGPHGLIAGTTGSGKSELLQTYILSLAVNFHPHDVAFLLIDYKGGGMANLFKKLPHLLGSITNLDSSQSRRALISIKAELKQRQRLFLENNVNHINQYQLLYKRGDISIPMPHLFLISDEFAELKSEQPEFINELISVSRIGRSLGIHLILATQKPSGVVNDQIWSNSTFKLCLKVADKADSMEMLKTPDAAEIFQTGRAYLQVGNNEIYELFQSAWSGAECQQVKEQQEDHRIYRITELNQYELINEDLSGLEKMQSVKQIPTQLEATIEEIRKTVEREKISLPASPWLPPLKERIAVTELCPSAFKKRWKTKKQKLVPVLGVIDLPGRQIQKPLKLNLTENGHLIVYSSPGYGKSTFLQTVIMDLVRVHSPEHLIVYLLDFGTNGLLPLKKLPHVAELMDISETEKILKFSKRMDNELRRRKNLLKEYAVSSLEMYEKKSGREEPAILVSVDNFEGMKGSDFEEVLEKLAAQIAREGSAVGMHLLLSAGRQSVLRMNLLSNIKLQVVLKLIDDLEPRTIVGRTSLIIDDLPGRGLVKFEEPELFQTALPAFGEDTLKVIEAVQKETEEMNRHWTGKRPESIPMIPVILDFDHFKNEREVQRLTSLGVLPVGADYDKVEVQTFDLERQLNLAVIGDMSNTFFSLKKAILFSLELLTAVQTMVIDSGNINTELDLAVFSYTDAASDFTACKESLLEEIRKRSQANYRWQMRWLVYITDMRIFEEKAQLTEEELKEMLSSSEKTGIHFIIAGAHQYMAQTRIGLPKQLRELIHTAVFSMKISDQSFIEKSFILREPELEEDSAYYYKQKEFIKIKFVRRDL